MKFLKNGGDKALGQFLEIARMGIGPLRKFLGGLVKATDAGINIFTDVPRNLWQVADDVLDSAIKAGAITSEKIKSYITIVKNITKSGKLGVEGSLVKTFKSIDRAPLKIGAKVEIGKKIEKQMTKRGWTRKSINELLQKPYKTIKTKDVRRLNNGERLSDEATAYLAKDGHYVVRNNKTGDIVQISDRFDPDWIQPF